MFWSLKMENNKKNPIPLPDFLWTAHGWKPGINIKSVWNLVFFCIAFFCCDPETQKSYLDTWESGALIDWWLIWCMTHRVYENNMSLHEYACFIAENGLNVVVISQLRFILTWGFSKRNVQRWWLSRDFCFISFWLFINWWHIGYLKVNVLITLFIGIGHLE